MKEQTSVLIVYLFANSFLLKSAFLIHRLKPGAKKLYVYTQDIIVCLSGLSLSTPHRFSHAPFPVVRPKTD